MSNMAMYIIEIILYSIGYFIMWIVVSRAEGNNDTAEINGLFWPIVLPYKLIKWCTKKFYKNG